MIMRMGRSRWCGVFSPTPTFASALQLLGPIYENVPYLRRDVVKFVISYTPKEAQWKVCLEAPIRISCYRWAVTFELGPETLDSFRVLAAVFQGLVELGKAHHCARLHGFGHPKQLFELLDIQVVSRR